MSKFTDAREFTITLENDKEITTEIETTWYYDPHYGADADGNRGIAMWDLDEILIAPFKEDDDGEPLTDSEISEAIKKFEDASDNYDWVYHYQKDCEDRYNDRYDI